MTSVLRLSWSEWNAMARQVAIDLKSLLPPETHTLCLQSPDLVQGLLGLCAGSQLGLQLLFDEKSQITASTHDIYIAPPVLAPSLHSSRILHLFPDQDETDPLINMDQLQVTFMTSGSTGQPKHSHKSGSGLKAEVKVLQELYHLQENQSVLSFVRPFHIYGFLHALLLPIQARAKLTFWPTHMHVPTTPFDKADLLIAVPSQWSLIDSLLSEGEIKTLISSGSAFGQERTNFLQKHPRKPSEAYEILGSTETGGIGYRSLLGEHKDFQLLNGVGIEATSDDGTWIASPFVAPERKAFTGDQLELLPDRRFRHLGRVDRVFKYSGKRFSLGEIEAALSQIAGGVAVVCHFIPDDSRAQGGILQAWIESESVDFAELRTLFLATHALPFPQTVLSKVPLPRDELGKLQVTLVVKN